MKRSVGASASFVETSADGGYISLCFMDGKKKERGKAKVASYLWELDCEEHIL